MKRFLAIYPPGQKFMRGEERCQSNIEDSTSTEIRACNDLGYLAAVMRNNGWEVELRDFQTEKASETDLFNCLQRFSPDVLFVSVTNATLPKDLALCNRIKQERPHLVLILKGAVFFNPPPEFFMRPDLQCADYLIAEEAECVIKALLQAHFHARDALKDVPRIFYRENGIWVRSREERHCDELDSLPFPARDLMRNELYVRPDTGEPMATIGVSRGCPSSCTFCMTPPMSGRKIRFRSPENIVAEMDECVTRFGITEFFFRADTFTIRREWTLALCKQIRSRSWAREIHWVANARASTLDPELLTAMKQAGCWLIAVGFESGSDETLKKVRKGTTVKMNLLAAQMVHQAKIKLFGFFMIGFPWETRDHIKETVNLIHLTRPDFLELHLATPFYGTELYAQIAAQKGALAMPLGCDYFKEVVSCSDYFSAEELRFLRKKIIRGYLFTPAYLWKRFCETLFSPRIFLGYTRHAWNIIRS